MVRLAPTERCEQDSGAEWSRQPTRVGRSWGLANATLYYRDDLRRRIGLSTITPQASHEELIIAALDTHGEQALHWLEGDFSFVWVDPVNCELVAARDFGGKRSLYFALYGDRLVLASNVAELLNDTELPRTLDLGAVASVAGGLWRHSADTAYAHIKEVPAGHALRWRFGGAPEVRAYWRPPDHIARRRQPLTDAAIELRALLERATAERMSGTAMTAVTLSGGWDSTSVYGVAQSLHASGRVASAVESVSISYPHGDPGREDELIEAATARWNTRPNFIDIDSIPLFNDWEGEARARALPFAHAYEHWNRALSQRARALGADVVLDGVGGDQLFQTSGVFLADLFRSGQWLELRRQFRHQHGEAATLRDLYGAAIRPALPRPLQRGLARVLRRDPPREYLERRPPIWFRTDFLTQHTVEERERASRPTLPTSSLVLAESHVYLRFAFYPRIFAELFGFAHDEGIELRSPLLDERVVRFAVPRPWSDRVYGAETKRLLRAAVAGLVPDSVLAPRPHRTGTTNAYFLREMRRAAWPIAQRLLPDLRLAALGMVEPRIYARAWEHLMKHDDDELAVRAFFTLQAELWIRNRGE